jgi:hypothetical protein
VKLPGNQVWESMIAPGFTITKHLQRKEEGISSLEIWVKLLQDKVSSLVLEVSSMMPVVVNEQELVLPTGISPSASPSWSSLTS